MKNAYLLAILQFASAAASATDVPYGSPFGIVGTLQRSWGTECCFNGEERQSHFPVLVMDSALSFSAPGSTSPNSEDVPEIGVTQMQLIIRSPELWREFEANFKRRARVVCIPYHAFTGHHMTPVTCDVQRIDAPNKP